MLYVFLSANGHISDALLSTQLNHDAFILQWHIIDYVPSFQFS